MLDIHGFGVKILSGVQRVKGRDFFHVVEESVRGEDDDVVHLKSKPESFLEPPANKYKTRAVRWVL